MTQDDVAREATEKALTELLLDAGYSEIEARAKVRRARQRHEAAVASQEQVNIAAKRSPKLKEVK